MGFSQLYYTSCERGLSGHPGYQFNAATPGVAPDVMADVESLTAYDPPKSVAYDSDAAQIARSPVNLCYRPGDSTVLANVVFVGNDYSRRFGNYFAHALVTDDIGRDLGDLLPIELWRAELWHRDPVDDPALPAVEHPVRGALDRAAVARFVAGHRASRHLAALLTAVDRVLTTGERKVVIVDDDADSVAHWIAAVSYLLPARAVRRMSFATYENAPRYSRLNVIGTVPESDVDRTAFETYHLFDLVAGETSGLPVHPLAEMLVYVGVESALELWRQAAQLADGDERGLDDWHAVVLASIGADRADAPVVVPWLARNAHRLGAATVDRIGSGLDVGGCPAASLAELAAAAREVGSHAFAEHVEIAWVKAYVSGDAQGPELSLRSPATRATAAGVVAESLRAAVLPRVADLLDWARRCEIDVDRGTLHEIGSRALGPKLLADPSDERVDGLLRTWPHLRAGVVEHVTARGRLPELVGLLKSDVAEVLALRQHPALTAAATIADAQTGAVHRTVALSRITTDVPPSPDVLEALWPDRAWTHDEASLLLRDLVPALLCTPPLLAWLDAALLAPPVDGDVYDRLCAQAREHPAFDRIPATTRRHVDARFRLGNMVEAVVRADSSQAFSARLASLRKSYAGSSPQRQATIREMLLDRMEDMPIRYFAFVLVKLPDLCTAYVDEARPDLQVRTANPQAAADLLMIVWELRRLGGTMPEARVVQRELEKIALDALRKWRRRPLRDTIALLRDQRSPSAAEWFQEWADEKTGTALTRFFHKRFFPRGSTT
ncbi:hypothetical protein FHS29_006217 [Saccharothrix tamanrassetensis]|uniref:Uncharacterized protein n=1 Tax=Saccharothrix tamanrassetensis TaxID=1051531 RepID=A0A841CW43_9PSEU|nr:GTPase-associated protein 1-related protein [Saccharothrix tamanrassetensis]MBB5959596.1 hypothetical protein [Saccharothrix tamanrassetensis]